MMYCKFCGIQIDDDAFFCSGCGKAQNGTGNSTTKANITSVQQSNELSMQAVSIYLHDVLTLELAIKEMREQIKEEQQNIQNAIIWRNCEDIPRPLEPVEPFMPERPSNKLNDYSEDGISLLSTFFRIISFAFDEDNGEGCFTLWATIPLQIIGLPVTAILGLIKTIELIRRRKMAFESYNNSIRQYEKNMAEYHRQVDIYWNTYVPEYNSLVQRRYDNADRKIDTHNNNIALLNEDIADAEKLLNTAYSTNVIPKQFRSLYPVFFLYDYLSSSRETLESALLQCKLDELEQKLTDIVVAQQKIILQNAVQIAKQEEIISCLDSVDRSIQQTLAIQENSLRNSQQILSSAQQSSENTSIASEYARIAAVNSQITTFFATWDHLK